MTTALPGALVTGYEWSGPTRGDHRSMRADGRRCEHPDSGRELFMRFIGGPKPCALILAVLCTSTAIRADADAAAAARGDAPCSQGVAAS